MIPKLLTYSATEGDAPIALRWAARFLLPDGSVHPVIFHGDELPALRDRATTWWADQLEIAKRKAGLDEKRIEALRKARAKARAAKQTKAEAQS